MFSVQVWGGGGYFTVENGTYDTEAEATARVEKTTLRNRQCRILPVDCYVSYNGYDQAFEIAHVGGHLDAHCPAADKLERELNMLIAEESHP
jgi:hypothetical protein